MYHMPRFERKVLRKYVHVLSVPLPCEVIVCIHVLLDPPTGQPGVLFDFRQCCVRSSLTTIFADLQFFDGDDADI